MDSSPQRDEDKAPRPDRVDGQDPGIAGRQATMWLWAQARVRGLLWRAQQDDFEPTQPDVRRDGDEAES